MYPQSQLLLAMKILALDTGAGAVLVLSSPAAVAAKTAPKEVNKPAKIKFRIIFLVFITALTQNQCYGFVSLYNFLSIPRI